MAPVGPGAPTRNLAAEAMSRRSADGAIVQYVITQKFRRRIDEALNNEGVWQ